MWRVIFSGVASAGETFVPRHTATTVAAVQIANLMRAYGAVARVHFRERRFDSITRYLAFIVSRVS
ncbi:MAG TPA: hypothetical protein VFH88_13850 [Candidatus Krumholzibacteria bacterium]|nr:hypothetical protein [Candidatus Krumholzibacteria bacterium]